MIVHKISDHAVILLSLQLCVNQRPTFDDISNSNIVSWVLLCMLGMKYIIDGQQLV